MNELEEAATMLLAGHHITGRPAAATDVAHALGIIAKERRFAEFGYAIHRAMAHANLAQLRALHATAIEEIRELGGTYPPGGLN